MYQAKFPTESIEKKNYKTVSSLHHKRRLGNSVALYCLNAKSTMLVLLRYLYPVGRMSMSRMWFGGLLVFCMRF